MTGTIVVGGDVCIDWLDVTLPAPDGGESGGPNWRQYRGYHQLACPGGAALLGRMVRAASGAAVAAHDVPAPGAMTPSECVRSVYSVGPVDGPDEQTVYRVQSFRGFSGPSDASPPATPVPGDDADAAVVVLDDAGNAFRHSPAAWPAALTTAGKTPLVVHKMAQPIAEGALWKLVRQDHASRVVVIVEADELRRLGVTISRRLSWERTATELVWQLAANPTLLGLSTCARLVVRFGFDAAIHCTRRGGEARTELIFDPERTEGAFVEERPGDMVGCNAAFVAAIAAHVARRGLDELGDGVADGLRRARALWERGFGSAPQRLDYPVEAVFAANAGDAWRLGRVRVPHSYTAESPDPGYWSILDEVGSQRPLEDMAYNTLVDGADDGIANVPVGRFGGFSTVDREEIERYRSVHNLIREYLNTPSPSRPLSIAVFGPPGSGKSFGVSQVAKAIGPGVIQKLTFNVSQFEGPSDLARALHRVRDVSLCGRKPLVFFDEFDSAGPDGAPLGWLKGFLAPMQDGEFRDGEAIHPIGPAIFVFAGGTRDTYEQFSDAGQSEEARTAFKNSKGPDFVSRLRGFINVKGPNPCGKDDTLYVIRRAVVIRDMLWRHYPALFRDGRSGKLHVDSGVVRALIKVSKYKHGMRSIESVLTMSSLGGAAHFGQSLLPPPDQLELHVGADEFLRLVERDVLFHAHVETIARSIHEVYLADNANEPPERRKPANHPSVRPWDELDENLKAQNLSQASHIPVKLKAIGCGYHPTPSPDPGAVTFTPAEVEHLAGMEHDRWAKERLLRGGTLGPKDPALPLQTPYLVPYEDLEPHIQDYDRQPVMKMAQYLAQAGFQIYRAR